MGPSFLPHQLVQDQTLSGLPDTEIREVQVHLTVVKSQPKQNLFNQVKEIDPAFFIEEVHISSIYNVTKYKGS